MTDPTPPVVTGATGALTDGTGVSALTMTKLAKDFLVDFLLSAAAALSAAQIMDVGSAIDGPQAAVFAIAGAAIRAGFRIVLRWAQTP